MDWSKTKNIFIVSFLLLNLLLGYQLYLKVEEQGNNLQWNINNKNELKEILSEQQINLNVDIPKEVPEMHFLQVKNIIYSSNNELKIKVEQPADKYTLESLIKESIDYFDHYGYHPIDSDAQNTFVYYQSKDEYPIFDAKLEITINEKQSINYSQIYFEVLDQGLDKEVITSYFALRTVLEQQLIPQGAEIQQIKLGYYGHTNQSSLQVLTPVWKIVYQTDIKIDELYVNAMTGGLENVIIY